MLALLALIALGVYGAFYYWTHRFDSLIVTQATSQELDPRLVKSLIYEESFFNPGAQSGAGARGLMQVTPIVVREWSKNRGYPDELSALRKEFSRQMETRRLSPENLIFDPEVNVRLGCWYLRFLLNKYQSHPLQVPLALAGYNAGPSNAERWLKQPASPPHPANLSQEEFIRRIDYPETREYVRRIIQRYDQYKRTNGGL